MTGYRIVHYDAGTHQRMPSVHNHFPPSSLSDAWKDLEYIANLYGVTRADHVTVYMPGSSIDHVYTIEAVA